MSRWTNCCPCDGVRGWKAAYAQACWFGSDGFKYPGDDLCNDPPTTAVQGVKFLTLAIVGSYSFTGTYVHPRVNPETEEILPGSITDITEITGSVARTNNCNGTTGAISVSGGTPEVVWEVTYTRIEDDGAGTVTTTPHDGTGDFVTSESNWTRERFEALRDTTISCSAAGSTDPIIAFSPTSGLNSGTESEIEAAYSGSESGEGYSINSTCDVILTGYNQLELSFGHSATAESGPDDPYFWSQDISEEVSFTKAYSNENPSSAAFAIAQGLLSKWAFANNDYWSWRTDDACASGPLVRHNISSAGGSPDIFLAPPYTQTGFPRADLPVGTILGEPGGIESTLSGQCRGAFTCFYPDGSELNIGRWPAGICTIGKWAEGLEGLFPSHNFDRPCGEDCTGQPGCVDPCPETVPNSWNDPEPKCNYVVRCWQYDFRDLAIDKATHGGAVTIRPVTRALKTIVDGQVTGRKGQVIALYPEAIGYDERFGSLRVWDVAQVMLDPIHACGPESGTCSSQACKALGVNVPVYSPGGCGASQIEEAIRAIPEGETLPAGSRPLGCADYVDDMNAGTGALVNPECQEPSSGSNPCDPTNTYGWVDSPWTLGANLEVEP